MGKQLVHLLVALSILLCSSIAWARKPIDITPIYGYQFGGSANTYRGELRFKDSENVGFTVDFHSTRDTTIQFLYTYQDTTVEFVDYYNNFSRDGFGVEIEYFHIGGTKAINSSNGTTSFVSGSLGATNFDPERSGLSSETLFSLSFGLGVNKMFTERVGFRAQGRLLIPIQSAGGSIFCGNGGCSAGISGGTTLVQADITAGLIVRF
ncbi:hypothetical protein [Kaarinaea lacus]